jgi:hypothetical protein
VSVDIFCSFIKSLRAAAVVARSGRMGVSEPGPAARVRMS